MSQDTINLNNLEVIVRELLQDKFYTLNCHLRDTSEASMEARMAVNDADIDRSHAQIVLQTFLDVYPQFVGEVDGKLMDWE